MTWRPIYAFAIVVALFGSVTSASAQIKLTYSTGFEPEFPNKREMNRTYRGHLNDLAELVAQRAETGSPPYCSIQIMRETHWLINYTTERDKVEDRLKDLRNSLSIEDQSFAIDQVPEDGSWGACYDEWVFRLHASVDHLKELSLAGKSPQYPLTFLRRVDTPREIEELMGNLLISDVNKMNHRKELNLVVTALGQLLLLPGMHTVFSEEFPRDELANALIQFIDERWQNPKTGYWGAWYQIGDELRKTDDLSMTFHIVSYRNGNVSNMGKIVNTTFDLRESPYPFGWQDRGTLNNHHNYDVATLLRFGWAHMTPQQQNRARAEIVIMLARSLRLTIDGSGAFYDDAYDNIGDAYYFGISFLDEVGFFEPSRRFWAPDAEFIGSDELRKRLDRHLARLDQRDPMVAAAKRKLWQSYSQGP